MTEVEQLQEYLASLDTTTLKHDDYNHNEDRAYAYGYGAGIRRCIKLLEVGSEEPIFILRAKDKNAVDTLLAYIVMLPDNEYKSEVYAQYLAFCEYAERKELTS